MKSKTKDRIEADFNKSFPELINEKVWAEGKSLVAIAKELNTTRQTITNICSRLGIKLRSHKDTMNIVAGRGEKHWAYGMRKETSSFAKMHSDRMKTNNPMKSKEVRKLRARTTSDILKGRDLWQERDFRDLIESTDEAFIEQHPIGPYNIDFFVPRLKLCIEIDSSWKWSYLKRVKAFERDAYLKKLGYWTVRINKKWLSNKSLVLDILRAYDIV